MYGNFPQLSKEVSGLNMNSPLQVDYILFYWIFKEDML